MMMREAARAEMKYIVDAYVTIMDELEINPEADLLLFGFLQLKLIRSRIHGYWQWAEPYQLWPGALKGNW
jgi:hypothetical protein